MRQQQPWSERAGGAALQRLVYQLLAVFVFLIALLLLPLMVLLKPSTALWLRLRLLPKPVTFQPKLWLHAVSLGEAKLALALLKQLPEPLRAEVLVTATTRAGHDFFAKHLQARQLCFLPWDLAWCYRRLLGRHAVPDVVLVETEIWPNLFFFAHRAAARLLIVNGRLGPKTLRYRRNPLLRRVMRCCHAVAARGHLDVERFEAFGVPADRIQVTGNMKFDLKAAPLPEEGVLRQWLDAPGPLFVFASISTDEVPYLAPAVSHLLAAFPDARVLWAPRHLDDLDRHCTLLEADHPVTRSRLSGTLVPRLLVLDTFGELAACYGYASLSLIGGSFNRRGGQNFLESLQAGTPALMGPSTENFRREVAEALAAEAIQIIPESQAVGATMVALQRDPARLQAMSARAADFIAKHEGAVDRSLLFLKASLADRPAAALFEDSPGAEAEARP